MTEREKEMLGVIGLLSLMVIVLLIVVGLGGDEEDPQPSNEWSNSSELRTPSASGDGLPHTTP